MAATPMTPSRFGASMQQSQLYGRTTSSLADSLPSVEFGFDELRERMTAFTARFDDFIARGRKRVLDERNAFRMSTAELKETRRARHQNIADFEQKSALHASTVAKEAIETEELQISIQTLQQEKTRQEQLRAERQAEVQLLEADIKQRRGAQLAHEHALDIQAHDNVPELRAWEDLLGLRIEGVEPNSEKLRFIFDDIDTKDSSRKACFEMDFAGRDLVVTSTKPALPKDQVTLAQQQLNRDGDIGTMLKRMRELFVRSMKS